MTITSTGPSGFHIKPVVTVLAVAAFAAAAYVFALQIWSNDQPSASAPAEAVAVVEAAEPYTGPSGSAEAFAAGKLDAGLVPEPSPATIGSEPVPEIVVIEGQGRLYDALIEGKYELDFSPGDPPVQYVLVPEAATGPSGQLVEGLGDGTFAERPPAASTAVPGIVVIEGQGRLYDALIEGKYDLDFSPGDPPLQYVLVPEAATGPSGQLVEGLGDGTFAERPPAARAAGSTPTVSGGPQE